MFLAENMSSIYMGLPLHWETPSLWPCKTETKPTGRSPPGLCTYLKRNTSTCTHSYIPSFLPSFLPHSIPDPGTDQMFDVGLFIRHLGETLAGRIHGGRGRREWDSGGTGGMKNRAWH